MKAPETSAVAVLGPAQPVTGGLYFQVEHVGGGNDPDLLVIALRLLRDGLDRELPGVAPADTGRRPVSE